MTIRRVKFSTLFHFLLADEIPLSAKRRYPRRPRGFVGSIRSTHVCPTNISVVLTVIYRQNIFLTFKVFDDGFCPTNLSRLPPSAKCCGYETNFELTKYFYLAYCFLL